MAAAKSWTERACILLRVSTEDQDEQNQEQACRQLCEARGWEVTTVLRVRKSGSIDSEEKLEAIAGVLNGSWAHVVVWALDRWSRQGIESVLSDMSRLQKAGGGIVSVKEPFTHDPLYGNLMAAILAWVAQWERQRRRDRTLEGLAESKRKLAERGSYFREKNGKVKKVERLGRTPAAPPAPEQMERLFILRNKGVAWRQLPAALRKAGMPYEGGGDEKWMTLRAFVVSAQKAAASAAAGADL